MAIQINLYNCGFTGFAGVGSFKTHQWMLEALVKSGRVGHTAYKILKCFKDRASADFKTVSLLKSLSRSVKRLSIIFSGYLYSHVPPLGVCIFITNYQDYITGVDYPEAWDDFRIFSTEERRPLEKPFTCIKRIGMYTAMNKNDELSLRKLLKERKPKEAIIGKAVELIRLIADRSEANGTIGKQITSVCLPRDPNNAPEGWYHSNTVTHYNHLPSQIVSISDNKNGVIMNPWVQSVESNGTSFMLVPKVSRKALCPCKSGKKYKHCHGKQKKRTNFRVSFSTYFCRNQP